ncbi:MAG: metal-dependent hydrolase [Halobacteriota archaeon]
MSTTHAAMGAAVAAALVPVAPDLAGVAALGAIAGGVFPDLDLAFEHRKTLHYPEHYWVVAVPMLVVASIRPGVWTVALAAFFGSAALHSVTDVFGGGLGLRPWEADDQRGVYSHWSGRWIAPRRWVRYDGAPEDVALVAGLSVVPVLVFDGTVQTVVLVGLAVSAAYGLVRRRLPDLYERLV